MHAYAWLIQMHIMHTAHIHLFTSIHTRASYIILSYHILYSTQDKNGNFINGEHHLAANANHSHTPNCEMRFYSVNKKERIGLYAKRDLKKGEEVTIDYRYVRVLDSFSDFILILKVAFLILFLYILHNYGSIKLS